MNRRSFIKCFVSGTDVAVAALASVVALPVGSALRDEHDEDPYGEKFMSRVNLAVARILRREQRGIRKLEIRVMHRGDDGRLYRRVTLQLNPGPSLLNKICFCWDELV